MSNSGTIDRISAYKLEILKFTTQLTAAFTFVMAVKLAPFTALLMAVFLTMVFFFSKSIVRGLFNLFLSAAITSVICSVLHALRISIGVTGFVILVFVFFAAVLTFLKRKSVSNPTLSLLQFEFCLTATLLFTVIFLRQLTHLNDVRLFAMLLPEDNASWIGASNGFVRYNATVGNVASMENGSKYFLALIIAIVSGVTAFTNSSSQPVISLVSIANTYALLILMLMAFTSAIAFRVFHLTKTPESGPRLFKSGKFALIGLIIVVSVGKVFLNAGHLSLICGAFVLCATSFGFIESASSENRFGGIDTFSKLNAAFLSSFAIGNAWLPLIPIALATMTFSLLFGVKSKVFIPVSKKNQRLSLDYVVNLLLFLVILLAAFHTLRIPSGYSISNLILNNPGGTIIPSAITLSVSIFGFVSIVNSIGPGNFNSFFLPLLPFSLLSFWLFSMNSLPEQPGYSVEKFSMLVAIIGLPFFVASLMAFYENQVKHSLAQLLSPIMLVFAVLLATWGINSFPRSSMLNKDNETLNYLPSLLVQATFNPNAQIQCLGTSPEYDMPAYTCSRFGAALQFREFGTGGLSRRWRSQLIGVNVDQKNILENENFLSGDLINNFLDAGGKLIVILIPGPKFQLDKRDDQPWIQDLPWDRISVVQ
jgi:hypothetical protein